MKKVFTFVALTLGLISVANAQYEPEKGDFSVEVGFTPFNTGGDAFKLNEGMMKARWFVSDKDALRLKLGLGIDNNSKTITDSYDPIKKNANYTIIESTSKLKSKAADFSFMLGYERHLFTKGRFDVYAGLELGFGMSKYNSTGTYDIVENDFDKDGKSTGKETHNASVDFVNQYVTNASVSIDPYTKEPKYDYDLDNNKVSQKYFSGNLFAGVDFYVWKNLYLGAECGLNFKTGKSPNVYNDEYSYSAYYKANGDLNNSTEIIVSGANNTTVTTTISDGKTDKKESNGHVISTEHGSTSFNLYVEPAIRIGWRF